MNLEEKVYLGDGLYAHCDGFQIILTAPRENGEHFVAFGPSALALLLRYADSINRAFDTNHFPTMIE